MALYVYLQHALGCGHPEPHDHRCRSSVVGYMETCTSGTLPPCLCVGWAWCRLAVAGYDVWCVWLVRRLAWWCRITVVIAWRCTCTSSTHWVVVTQSPTTIAAAPQSWDTWKRVPPAHCRLACALVGRGVASLSLATMLCGWVVATLTLVMLSYGVWFDWLVPVWVCCRHDVWCVCCMVAFGARLWRVVGVVVLCSVAWRV